MKSIEFGTDVWIKQKGYKRRKRGYYIRFDEEKQKHVVAFGIWHYSLDESEIEIIEKVR